MNFYVGTSGYSYKEWKGPFYPDDLPGKEMLRFYGERFRSVEINNTFYRMPKASVLEAKMTLTAEATEKDKEKAEQYKDEQAEIKREAEAKQSEAKSNFHKHEVFARGVTMFQIAIAIAAISALTKRQRYWILSMILGAVGCVFLVLGWIAH